MTEFSTHDRGRAGAAARTRDRSAGPGPPRRRGRRDASDVGRDGVAGRESQSGRRVARRHSPDPDPEHSAQTRGGGPRRSKLLKVGNTDEALCAFPILGRRTQANAPKQQTRLSALASRSVACAAPRMVSLSFVSPSSRAGVRRPSSSTSSQISHLTSLPICTVRRGTHRRHAAALPHVHVLISQRWGRRCRKAPCPARA